MRELKRNLFGFVNYVQVSVLTREEATPRAGMFSFNRIFFLKSGFFSSNKWLGSAWTSGFFQYRWMKVYFSERVHNVPMHSIISCLVFNKRSRARPIKLSVFSLVQWIPTSRVGTASGLFYLQKAKVLKQCEMGYDAPPMRGIARVHRYLMVSLGRWCCMDLCSWSYTRSGTSFARFTVGVSFWIGHEQYRGRPLDTRQSATGCAAKAYAGLEEHPRSKDHKWSLDTYTVDLKQALEVTNPAEKSGLTHTEVAANYHKVLGTCNNVCKRKGTWKWAGEEKRRSKPIAGGDWLFFWGGTTLRQVDEIAVVTTRWVMMMIIERRMDTEVPGKYHLQKCSYSHDIE